MQRDFIKFITVHRARSQIRTVEAEQNTQLTDSSRIDKENVQYTLFGLRRGGYLAVHVWLAMRVDGDALAHLCDVAQVQVCQHELGLLVRGIAHNGAPITCEYSN